MLPITRVVLFKHGVGYFQRTGMVDGRDMIELGFKAAQMNDVLKSLTALDYGGGSFAALSYDSEEPLDRRLAELSMEIPPKSAISAFLDQLKGATVSVAQGSSSISGSIVGIEEVKRTGANGMLTEPHLAILSDDAKLVRIPLLEISELTFEDDTIKKDLRTLLDILFSGLRKDRKRLSIQAVGDGMRKVSISYVIEAPVWKTSYRIVLPGSPEDKALLQGWALVDNTTEDDWKQVSLSLVAGLPISFIHDLYTPRYRQRPVIEVEEEAAVAPPVLEASLDSMDMMGEQYPEEMAEQMPMRSAARAKRMAPAAAAPPPAPMAKLARKSTQVHTRTQEVGDLFAYEITHPVDVASGRSALVPILQKDTDVERVAIYNEEVREKNPMTAFRIKNTTGLTLEGGPVTVFEGDSYVGEAMLDTMRKDEKRITPYSVELGIKVSKDRITHRENYTRVSKHSQYIYKHYRNLLKTTYHFHSGLDRAMTTYVDHRFTYDSRLDTMEPEEITDNFWRFKIQVSAHEKIDLEVTEIAHETESVHIPGISFYEIESLAKQGLIADSIKDQLESIAEMAESISRLSEKRDKLEEKIQRVEDGQARLRENLKALGTSSEEAKLRQKYVTKLGIEEEQLEKLRKEVDSISEQIETLQDTIEKAVEELDFS